MTTQALAKARIEAPKDALELVCDLVKRLGGRVLKTDSEEEYVYISPPIPERERIGRMLKGARLRAGMTQKQLAAAIKVPQSHISGFEKNKRPIPRHKAEELAKLLNTVPTHFLESEGLQAAEDAYWGERACQAEAEADYLSHEEGLAALRGEGHGV